MQKQEMNCLPKSLAEARTLGHNLYYTGKPCKHGHLTYRYVNERACSDCVKLKVKKSSTVGGGNARRWLAKTEEQRAAIYAKRKAYYEQTKAERQLEKLRSYYKLKQDVHWLEKRRVKINKWKQDNPHKVRADTVKRRTAKMKRTPAWLTEDDLWLIEQAYELAALRTKLFGFGWHVDHVIPLQGTVVSGLHVPTNLQVIPWIQNVSKANKYSVA
jgi:hypothetical protein